jgi:glycosyltransferase involved in cell wall biosynthesis
VDTINGVVESSNNLKRILYVVNVDWFFISHRLPLAIEAKKRNYEVTIATKNTGRFNELKSKGFKLIELDVDRSGSNAFKEFIFILQLIVILRKVKPTIIHNVTLKMSIYCSIATRFFRNIKVINAISGLGYNFTANRKTSTQKIINILMKLAFSQRGFSFIFQNPDDEQLFKNLNFEVGNKFYLIKGAGVDLDKYTYTERINLNNISFILIARMLKDKGISEFIRASRIVTEQYPDSKFILVGDLDNNNLASYTKNELTIELIGTNVNWLGYRNDIFDLLRASDVVVLPSYREGLPKSLIEAAATGLPIITTDSVGCRECVDDGVNGFLVPVGNSSILAQKMIELIENPQMINKMGKASRLKAEKEFSLSTVIEKTFELYE